MDEIIEMLVITGLVVEDVIVRSGRGIMNFAQLSSSSTEGIPPLGSPQQQLPNSSISRSVQRSVLPQVQRNTRYLAATDAMHRCAVL